MKHKQLLKAVLVLVMVLAHLPVQPTYAATITVDTSSDVLDAAGGNCSAVTILSLPGLDGDISLREAICAANNTAGSDIIGFNIDPLTDPGCSGGVCTIQPGSGGLGELPALDDDDGTTIDGYTQTGATPAMDTTPAVLKIELDGTSAGGSANGFRITSAGNTIRGLVINRFGNGVSIENDDNTISGNHIGTDASGTLDRGNYDGVAIYNGAQNNTVGGDTAGERNVISGNDSHGLFMDSGAQNNTVSGNYIGLAANGTDALGNRDGVLINGGAQNNTIGGDTAGERNVISGNDDEGIRIDYTYTMSNTISGNYIGLAANGTDALGNTQHGVYIGGAQNNTVGGDTEGERNVISGNGYNGVDISGSDGNTVLGNYIGLAANGTVAHGNAWNGVNIRGDSQNNTIGPDNVVAHNGYNGVGVSGSSPSGNIITQNSIFSNTMGILLGSGANGDIEAPTIMTTTLGTVNIVGEDACPDCTVEVFENSDTDGEGETYLGSAIADGSGNFTVTVTYLTKPYLTATATDETYGTSEFSDVFEATVELSPPLGPVYLPIILRNY
jgi:hypothetical protein